MSGNLLLGIDDQHANSTYLVKKRMKAQHVDLIHLPQIPVNTEKTKHSTELN